MPRCWRWVLLADVAESRPAGDERSFERVARRRARFLELTGKSKREEEREIWRKAWEGSVCVRNEACYPRRDDSRQSARRLLPALHLATLLVLFLFFFSSFISVSFPSLSLSLSGGERRQKCEKREGEKRDTRTRKRGEQRQQRNDMGSLETCTTCDGKRVTVVVG